MTVAVTVTNALREEDNKPQCLICVLDSLHCYIIFRTYLMRNVVIRHFGTSPKA